MGDAHEVRVAVQKRLSFIRSMQFQNKVPSDDQFESFLSSVKDQLRELSSGNDDLSSTVSDLIDEKLTDGIAFGDVDDALEDILATVRKLEVEDAMNAVHATDEEIDSVPLAIGKMWDLDINRLEPNLDYVLDLQAGKRFHEQDRDTAERPLFKYVSRSVFSRPTYSLFYSLLDNYVAATGVEETASQEEVEENNRFLDVICSTPVMKYAHQYAVAKGWLDELKDPADVYEFKRFLYRLWFYFYRREGQNDSSGFEHAFLGEIRDGSVIGLHNWIQILRLERSGELDYTGYIVPRRRSSPLPDGEDHILGIQFTWQGAVKPMSSIFVGVSPEFEVAIYTLCFLALKNGVEGDDGKFRARLEHDLEVAIVVHLMGRHNPRLGSSYPEIIE